MSPAECSSEELLEEALCVGKRGGVVLLHARYLLKPCMPTGLFLADCTSLFNLFQRTPSETEVSGR